MNLSLEDCTSLNAALDRMGLAGPLAQRRFVPLVGGVSSLIVRVDTPAGSVCIKRALAQLRVAAQWYAPVSRNRAEVDWIRLVSALDPTWVPEVLGYDPDSQSFAMQYLPEAEYPVWKSLLRDGQVSTSMASAVGDRIGQIHAATARREDLQELFAHQDQFYALRLEPYFLAAGEKNASVRSRLDQLVARTLEARFSLVHGDISPKNILVGPQGPVFLDAECAVYGDPAFDLAFCLNHLLLKSVWRPAYRDSFFACFRFLTEAHARHVSWEPLVTFHQRSTELLAALLLARIDGKSPVEYLTEENDKQHVRGFALAQLRAPAISPMALLEDWSQNA